MNKFFAAILFFVACGLGHTETLTQTESFEIDTRKFAGLVLSQGLNLPQINDPYAGRFFMSTLRRDKLKDVIEEVVTLGGDATHRKAQLVTEKYSESLDHLKVVFNAYGQVFNQKPLVYGMEFLLCFDANMDVMSLQNELTDQFESKKTSAQAPEVDQATRALMASARSLARTVMMISLQGLATTIGEDKFSPNQKGMALDVLRRNIRKVSPALSQEETMGLLKKANSPR